MRAAVLPLVGIVGALVLVPADPAVAEVPAASLVASPPTVTDGSVSFVLTARYYTKPVPPAAIKVRVGGVSLATTVNPPSGQVTGIPPRAMIVVFDSTLNVTPAQLAWERGAATTIASGLPPDVKLGLVVVGSPDLKVPPTQSRAAFTDALAGLKPAGTRALYDAVSLADSLLSGELGDSERRIVIIGTGVDTGSTVTGADLSAELSSDEVVTDAMVGDPTNLDGPVRASGGTMHTVTDDGAAANAARAEVGVFQPAQAVTATVPPALAGSTSTIAVTVDGTKLATTVSVTFAGTPPVAASATQPSSYSWVPGWLGWALGGVLFLALVIAILGVAWPRSLKHERIRQIGNFGPGAKAQAAPKTSPDVPVSSVIARTALAATASVVRTGKMEERIARRLERAGMRMRAHEWVLLRACVVVACGALLFAVAGPVGGLIGVAIGWVSTLLFQSVRIDRRSNQFSEQLPDALQLVIGSLKSGFSLPQAFDSLVRESQEPVASEFGRALSEHRLGADISDALERVAQRSQSEDLGWTVMSVRIQREVGGNLAEVLQTTVDTMRERGRLRRHVRSLSAEGRISAYVLIGLPLVLGFFMFLYRRDYMAPLFTDPLGVILLSLGGLLFVLGIFWMTRVIKVEA